MLLKSGTVLEIRGPLRPMKYYRAKYVLTALLSGCIFPSFFAMEMVQLGKTEVDSITWGMEGNKWINCFIANIKVANGSLDIVSIQDVLGDYQNGGRYI